MKITLTTRTPVHIGTGQIYHPNEFVWTLAREGILYLSRINQSAFLANLTEDQREDLITQMDDQFKLTEFFKKYNLNPKDLRRYRAISRTGKKNPLDIRECIKTADLPYIPGSSLKGAIRTALLWNQVKDDDRYFREISREFDNDHRSYKKRNIGDAYVDEIFNCSQNRADPKYDLLRFLQISDCMPVEQKLSIESVQTSSLKNHTLQKKPYEIYAECVNGTFTGSVGGLDQIQRVVTHRDYSYLKDKISYLGMSNASDIQAVPDHLNKVITEWSRWCIEKERNLISVSGGLFEETLDQVSGWTDTGAHIRLGFGVGTLYQTMIGLISEKDPGLAIDIINQFSLGKYPRDEAYGEIEPPYPKSIEFSNDEESFGWLRFHAE